MNNKDLQEEFEELMGPYLYGESSPEETERLLEITESEPELKRRYENYVRMQSGLKSHPQSLSRNLSSSSETSETRLENRFRKPVYGFLALAASLLIVFGVYRYNSGGIDRPEKALVHTLGNCDFQSLRSG
ncbi:anti-sigma factor family protein, partial [Leptospira ellisii]